MKVSNALTSFQSSQTMVETLAANKWMGFLRNKDLDTYRHCLRVANMSKKVAAVFQLAPHVSDNLITGCFLHDLGKIMIPSDVLLQKGSLDYKQWFLVRMHPQLGAELLEHMPNIDREIIDVVRYHHERWDGNGYPEGLSREQIPFLARICAIIDAFDCMISNQPYRGAMSAEEAKNELIRNSGTQFDSRLVPPILDCLK
ncbi:HD-GYP domain-containing protein [Cohnella sp.]|uniref:HD-GYP domain-containing protein n=1 Tax=Cohnella sp. TaxID=1883426 RepID=UPI0035664032